MSESMIKIQLSDLSEEQLMKLTGANERNLNALAEEVGTTVSCRDEMIFLQEIDSHKIEVVQSVVSSLCDAVRAGRNISEQDVIYACRLCEKNETLDYEDMNRYLVGRTLSGKPVYPKTNGQLAFARAMENSSIVFAV